MAGWFYLGTSSAREQHHHLSKDEANRSDEIYRHGGATTKGFELWPQCYEADHPFAGGSSEDSGRRVNLIDFSDECWRSGVTSAMRPGGGGSGGTAGVGVGGTNCQDCGNQAKKDCPHIRCRTCCKSRGLQCSTHLKSTWVPAAKRRERQQQQQQIAGMQQPFRISENPKRPRQEHGHPHHQQQQQLVAARSSGDLGLEVGQHYPPEVNSPAVFRCVRVTGVDDTDEEFAYQTSVNIAGHVFKGILYDQGPEEGSGGGVARNYSSAAGGGGESSGAAHHHHHQQQQFSLMAASAAATSGSNPSAMIDPSLFPAPLNAFMAGTQFFPPPRS